MIEYGCFDAYALGRIVKKARAKDVLSRILANI